MKKKQHTPEEKSRLVIEALHGERTMFFLDFIFLSFAIAYHLNP